jgi:hypothetical protein
MDNKTLIHSFISALGVFIYVSAVAWIMTNAEGLSADAPEFWIPVAMLLLFVLSATIVGLIVLGRPIYLFQAGQKLEAIKLLFMTLSWMAVTVVIVLAFLLS